MTSYFDLVINCDLRPDLPQEYVDAMRYLTSAEGTVPLPIRPQAAIQSEVGSDLWNFISEEGPLLSPDPHTGFIANFYSTTTFYRDKAVHQYHLQLAAHHTHSDLWANGLAEFFYWLPTIAADGFIGYHKTESNELHLLYAKEGRCVDQNGNSLVRKPGPLLPDL